jgi:TonB family protein
MPLAGRTEGGAPAKPAGLMPLGGTGEGGSGNAVALSKENLSDIQKRQPGMGVTLSRSGLAEGGVRAGGGMPMASGAGVKERKINFESLKANPNEKMDWGNQKGPFSMEGPLKYRKIVKFTPPPYPRWAEEQGIETSVSYRLWVDPRGRVRDNNMYLEKASGYSEIDNLARDALLKMIFVPLPPETAQEDEWGIATFRFELKKGGK